MLSERPETSKRLVQSCWNAKQPSHNSPPSKKEKSWVQVSTAAPVKAGAEGGFGQAAVCGPQIQPSLQQTVVRGSTGTYPGTFGATCAAPPDTNTFDSRPTLVRVHLSADRLQKVLVMT